MEKKTQVLAEGTGRIPIVMTAGNVRVEGVLDDSETSRDFSSRKSDLYGQDYLRLASV
ncbi:MAG: hypothetical protein K6F95_08085 [Selenomonas sp.]|nr:hypothetical protein [Selenomonas sp.]